jgi:hypothetical protein
MSRTSDLWELWHHFNRRYFGSKLTPPLTIRLTRAQKYQGSLVWKAHKNADKPLRSHIKRCKIHISSYLSWYETVGTLLHEMVHQYQLQALEVGPCHDATFRVMCKWIERETKFQLRK